MGTSRLRRRAGPAGDGCQVLGTEIATHPLRTWSSETQGGNVFVMREDYMGVFAEDSVRKPHDVVGSSFALPFQIVDNRASLTKRQYRVTVRLGMGPVLYTGLFMAPGKYVAMVDAPKQRQVSCRRRVGGAC